MHNLAHLLTGHVLCLCAHLGLLERVLDRVFLAQNNFPLLLGYRVLDPDLLGSLAEEFTDKAGIPKLASNA